VKKMQIKVYSTQTCPWCVRLKEYLRSKKIKFQEVDVSEDEEAANEMIEKSGQMGVPQIEINGKMIVGFDKEAIDEELANSK
jgi:glutaredoxin-like YruB-family protein